MIRITCTHCKAQLSIDEAFAGGACRCQFCGTIQTVPKHLKNAGAEGIRATAGVGGGQPKAMYRPRTKSDTGLSSGLDALADAVAGSGLSGSGLGSGGMGRSKLTGAADAENPPVKNRMVLILAVTGIVIVLLLGVVIGLLMKGSGSEGSAGTPPIVNNPPPPMPEQGLVAMSPPPLIDPLPALMPAPKITGPSFFGVKLTEPTVIFVLDRGGATHTSFEYMKMACLNTLDSFAPEQKYQIIFWRLDQEKDPVIIPKSPARADNKVELKKTGQAVDEVASFGQSDLKASLDKAFAAKPGAIVIATGKAVDDGFTKIVMDARKGANVKVHCFSLVERNSNKAMTDVANKTGGTFKFVTLSELQSVTR